MLFYHSLVVSVGGYIVAPMTPFDRQADTYVCSYRNLRAQTVLSALAQCSAGTNLFTVTQGRLAHLFAEDDGEAFSRTEA